MPAFIGPRGMAALERVNAALDLDYCGIDFAVNAAGDILLFEANATMVMVPLSGDPKWDYRRPAFERCSPLCAGCSTSAVPDVRRAETAASPQVARGCLIFNQLRGAARPRQAAVAAIQISQPAQ